MIFLGRSFAPAQPNSPPFQLAAHSIGLSSCWINREDIMFATEEGKTLPEATGETVRAGRIFKYFAGEALRRLAENWQSGKNRFSAPGEKLLGAFVAGQLVGVCGLNIDPFSPQLRAGRIRHLYISDAFRRQNIGQQLLVAVITHSGTWFDFLNTHAPSTAWSFYENLGFRPVYDEPLVTRRLLCAL